MKKIVLSILFVVSTVAVQAEKMEFITWLSQPAGVFGSVDVLGTDEDAAKIFFLNFCDEAIEGTMEVNSLYANKLLLSKEGTSLTSPQTTGAISVLESKLLVLQKIANEDSDEDVILSGGTLQVSGILDSYRNLHLRTTEELVLTSNSQYSFDAASFKNLEITDSGKEVSFQEPTDSSLIKSDSFKWEKISCTSGSGINCTSYLLFHD